MSKILISGGAGYIGTELVRNLLKKDHDVTVLDRCFFGMESVQEFLNNKKYTLLKDDIRYFDKAMLRDIDIVIDLAGISNDPSCDLDPNATESINHKGCMRLGKLAKNMGVKRYIMSSSCSIYGQSSSNALTETSKVNPVSLYARLKLAAEKEIRNLMSDDFCVTFLRNATLYGVSNRMRFDLVVNMMVLFAHKKKHIFITGQGQQWRPIVHIGDVARAFELVIKAPAGKVNGEIFNVGSSKQNYKILQIAHFVRDIVPSSSIEIVPDDPDRRTYNVCFDKISKTLGFATEKTLKDGIVEIYNALKDGVVSETVKTNTLGYYKYLLDAHKTLREVLYKGEIF